MTRSRSRRIDGTLFERFADKVLVGDECWEWQAGHHSYGYGVMGNGVYAHRASYQLFRGPLPRTLCVCHTCDNPNCVRPSHLFLGSKRDNSQDMLAKGRNVAARSGAANPNARLDPVTVGLIRQLVEQKQHSLRAIGRRFGISHQTVRAIRDRRAWKEAP